MYISHNIALEANELHLQLERPLRASVAHLCLEEVEQVRKELVTSLQHTQRDNGSLHVLVNGLC